MADPTADRRGDRPRLTIESRPNDFKPSGSVTVHAGCCCCCCCLHWAGAAVGGAIGVPLAWAQGRRKSPLPVHPRAKRALWGGLLAGIGATALLIVTLILLQEMFHDSLTGFLLMAFVFVPSLVFVPIGACMVGATAILEKMNPPIDDQATDADGIYCAKCFYDLRGSPDSSSCPECGAPLDPKKVMRGFDYGTRIAWRITWMSFLLASLLSGVGYLIMIPMFK